MEDEPELRRLLARWLARSGFEVTEAADGVAALEKLRWQTPDAVVSDIRMPKMGGLELLERLLELNPKLPVVLMSGSDEVTDAAMARGLGACDFLPKPLDLRDLSAAVARAVDQHAASSAAPQQAHPSPRRSGKILVVDDYADARGVLRDALEEAGHSVVEAENGQAALNWLVSRLEPDVGLITLDLMMPVMDGFKFLELLHNYVRLSTIPVVIVSSKAQEVKPEAHSAIIGRITAPFRLKELLNLVNGCVAPAALGQPA